MQTEELLHNCLQEWQVLDVGLVHQPILPNYCIQLLLSPFHVLGVLKELGEGPFDGHRCRVAPGDDEVLHMQ